MLGMAHALKVANDLVWSWPLVFFVTGVSAVWTVALGGAQIRCLPRAWRDVFSGGGDAGTGKVSPRQAFINTLSANMGNGAFAGMAIAVCAGGPGAGFWALVFGILTMSVRFAEVYLSTEYGKNKPASSNVGGPMLYLGDVIGGSVLPYLYAIPCLLFGMTIGNAIQANSIVMCVETTCGIPHYNYVVAVVLTVLTAYVVMGGAARVSRFSDMLVPLKVGLFFIPCITLLAYHYANIGHALWMILLGAFNPGALAGGALGFTVQQAMRFGLDHSVMANESGLGTAGIMFGFTGSKDATRSALMGMLSAFISTLVCFLVVLCLVASGVWDSGLNSMALNIAAFETLFGGLAGWLVSTISIIFGLGLLVAYAYVMHAVWMFLTGGKYEWMFNIIYPAFTAFGALATVGVVRDLGSLANGLLLYINLFGLLWLLPKVVPKIRASLFG